MHSGVKTETVDLAIFQPKLTNRVNLAADVFVIQIEFGHMRISAERFVRITFDCP